MRNNLKMKLINFLDKILPDSIFLFFLFRNRVGYYPNLINPKTFCEKIQILKLRSKHRPEFASMVDKVEAKTFVASIIGDEYVIPTLGVWSAFDDINFENLPDGFILKCTHDSSKGIVVRDKHDMDISAMRERMNHYLQQTYSCFKKEYPYKNVPHRLIAEKFLVNGDDEELKDYKFYCFAGRAEFCQIIANRLSDETIDFYDRNWQLQEFIGLNPSVHHSLKLHERPRNYDEMLNVADKLSKSINTPFVRIDLYSVNGKTYFGEITFFPASGMGKFSPEKWDFILGSKINLERNI